MQVKCGCIFDPSSKIFFVDSEGSICASKLDFWHKRVKFCMKSCSQSSQDDATWNNHSRLSLMVVLPSNSVLNATNANEEELVKEFES